MSPNFKLAWQFRPKWALTVLLPGATYRELNKDRGYEGLIIGLQYWIHPKLWLMLGTGLTFDAAAFYTVKDPKKAAFFTGLPAYSTALGYQLYHFKKLQVDLHYRLFYGEVNASNGLRTGLANMLLVGLNWQIAPNSHH